MRNYRGNGSAESSVVRPCQPLYLESNAPSISWDEIWGRLTGNDTVKSLRAKDLARWLNPRDGNRNERHGNLANLVDWSTTLRGTRIISRSRITCRLRLGLDLTLAGSCGEREAVDFVLELRPWITLCWNVLTNLIDYSMPRGDSKSTEIYSRVLFSSWHIEK